MHRGNDVVLLGHYGGDETHATSAWTSTSRDLTDEKRARRPALLQKLAEEGHHSPFEKSMLHFLVVADTATHVQIIKHRSGVSVNAESARYKEHTEDKFHVPDDWPPHLQEQLHKHAVESFAQYHQVLAELVASGMDRKRAKESARFFLPYASQVVLDVSFNFRSFMHFIGLRMAEDAQLEIRQIAEAMLYQVWMTDDFDESLAGFGY